MMFSYKSTFIRFVGRLLLEPSASAYSSFMTSSFLIQMLRWIRGSSRFEPFIFPHRLRDILWMVRAWSSHLLFSYYESIFFLCVLFPESTEINHFLLAHIPHMNESHDPGRPFKVAITTFAFSTSSSTTTSCSLVWEMAVWSLHSGSSHSSTGFLSSYSDLCSSLQIAWSRNKKYSVSLGRHFWYKLICDWIHNDLLGLDQVLLV